MADEKPAAEGVKRKLPKGRHVSAIKRHRQNLKRAEANRTTLSIIRTAVKRVSQAIAKKDVPQIQASLRIAVSQLHKAAARGLIKGRNASRHIARLSSLAAHAG